MIFKKKSAWIFLVEVAKLSIGNTTIESLTLSSRNIHANLFLKMGMCSAKGITKNVPKSEECPLSLPELCPSR